MVHGLGIGQPFAAECNEDKSLAIESFLYVSQRFSFWEVLVVLWVFLDGRRFGGPTAVESWLALDGVLFLVKLSNFESGPVDNRAMGR